MTENRHISKSIYDLLGQAAFDRLVAAFYRRVQAEPLLAPLYPQHDMEGAERRLRLFLTQYFGGPTTYLDERGHPRLRMRHAPYQISMAERDAWVAAMLAAMQEANIEEPAYSIMRNYFENAATFMINHTPDGTFDT
jgi:hemoglobin